MAVLEGGDVHDKRGTPVTKARERERRGSSARWLLLKQVVRHMVDRLLEHSTQSRPESDDRLRVWEGTMRAEDAQGTPTQSRISPSILVYEDE